MAKHSVSFLRYGRRSIPDAAFVDSFGEQTQKSVSVASENRAGTPYLELPEGQCYAQFTDGVYYPMAYDSAQAAVAGGNDVEVEDIQQFFKGDYVELPTSVDDGAGRFRKVDAVDEDTDKITLSGAAFNLSEDDKLEVDPSRAFDTVQNAGTTVSSALEVADASKFKVDDVLDVGTAKKVLEFQTPGGADGEYRIGLDIEDVGPVVAEYEAAGNTELQIVTELKNDLDDQLEAAVATVALYDEGSTGTNNSIRVTFVDPNVEADYAASAAFTVAEDDTTGAKVTAVDTGTNTLTLDDDITLINGELVVSQKRGEYKIASESIRLAEYTHTHQNPMVLTRRAGEARKRVLTGLTPTVEAALAGPIEFNEDI